MNPLALRKWNNKGELYNRRFCYIQLSFCCIIHISRPFEFRKKELAGILKLGIFNVIPPEDACGPGNQSFNTYFLEALYKKYGMYPLQNGG
jgi:hypothetical protein